MQPGDRVRVTGDPARVGTITGRERERGGLVYRQVAFPDNTTYVPIDQLELISEGPQGALDAFEAGRLAGPRDLRRTLTHIRLTGRLANVLYSMETTETDFYAYQFKPVVRMLNSPRNGVLIADEVGLGKTIEAGLIWTELRARYDCRRLFVLCPAMLQDKWQTELRRRFGVNAEICDSRQTLRRLKQAAEGGAGSGFTIVASLQGLRPRRTSDPDGAESGSSPDLMGYLEERAEFEPLIDLLIIDEAHHLRNPETKSARLGRALRAGADHIVLLTATPIHLRNADLFQLLNLVDPELFPRDGVFDEILQANAPLVRARDMLMHGQITTEDLGRCLQEAGSHYLLRDSSQLAFLASRLAAGVNLQDRAVRVEWARHLEEVNLLAHVVNRTRKRDVNEWRVIRDPSCLTVTMSPVEEQFYNAVTDKVRDYCATSSAPEGFLLVMPQRQMASCMPAALRYWQNRGAPEQEEVYEDFGALEEEDGLGPLVKELIEEAAELGSFETLRASDSKFSAFLVAIERLRAQDPRARIVVFSYFRETLRYLQQRLADAGISAPLLLGGMKNKEETLSAFRRAAAFTILLSSEVGSEGIDLEFCSAVVNYDLPWNPMHVEQRIGRVDRLGQKAPRVPILNLVYDNTIDSRIYQRLFVRLGLFERALGGLEDVLGKQVRELGRDLLRQHLTPAEEEARIEQTAKALLNNQREEEALEASAAHLVAYGEYIINEIQAARELSRRVSADDLRSYVLEFFRDNYPGAEFATVHNRPLEYIVRLPADARATLDAFLQHRRLTGLTGLARGDAGGKRCVFENTAVYSRRAGVEVLSQFHPLVRFVSARMHESGLRPHGAFALVLDEASAPAGIMPGVYVFCVQRWSMRGIQDMELLAFGATALDAPQRHSTPEDAERLVAAAALSGRDWPAAVREVSLVDATAVANEHCLAMCDARYSEHLRAACARNEDRANIQLRGLERHLEVQEEKLRAIRDKHKALGRESLVRATEGRIAALRARVETQKAKTAAAGSMSAFKEELCVGVIRVAKKGR